MNNNKKNNKHCTRKPFIGYLNAKLNQYIFISLIISMMNLINLYTTQDKLRYSFKDHDTSTWA